MSIPKAILKGLQLSKTDRKIQKRALLKAIKKYNKKEYLSRPKLESFKSKESRHITDFHKKYNIKISHHTLPEIAKKKIWYTSVSFKKGNQKGRRCILQ